MADLKPYIAELVGFVAFLFVVVRMIWPRIRVLMDKRLETIKASIEAGASLRAGAEKDLERRRAMLDEAKAQAVQIVAQARETAEQLTTEGRRRGDEDYQRLVDSANAEIALERARARDEIAAAVGGVIVAAAEQVVRAELDTARQRALIGDVIAVAGREGAAA